MLIRNILIMLSNFNQKTSSTITQNMKLNATTISTHGILLYFINLGWVPKNGIEVYVSNVNTVKHYIFAAS